MKTKLLALCVTFLLSLVATGIALAVVPVTEEPGHIVRYRSPHFVIYTNHFAPGDWTLYHEHKNDLLAVIAGETVAINQKAGAETTEQRVPAGTVAFFPYADLPNGYVHRVSVGGTQPFINVGVDFQDAVASLQHRASLPVLTDKAVTVIGENRRGRAYRVELEAGQSLALPETGSAVLLVGLSSAEVALEGNGEAVQSTLGLGDFRFFETTWPKGLSNKSKHAARLVIFQAY